MAGGQLMIVDTSAVMAILKQGRGARLGQPIEGARELNVFLIAAELEVVYALAATHAEPLLFKGNDSSGTDLHRCLPNG